MRSQLWVPAGNLIVYDVKGYSGAHIPYDCHIPYETDFEEDPRICAVSSGISFKDFCHSPQPFSHLTTLCAFREELHVYLFCVCVHIKYYMKYWKTDIRNIMSWVFWP